MFSTTQTPAIRQQVTQLIYTQQGLRPITSASSRALRPVAPSRLDGPRPRTRCQARPARRLTRVARRIRQRQRLAAQQSAAPILWMGFSALFAWGLIVSAIFCP